MPSIASNKFPVEFYLNIGQDQGNDYIGHCTFDINKLELNPQNPTATSNNATAGLMCTTPTPAESDEFVAQKKLEDESRVVMDNLLVNGTEITCPPIAWANNHLNGGIEPKSKLEWYHYNNPNNPDSSKTWTPDSSATWDSVSGYLDYFSAHADVSCKSSHFKYDFNLSIQNNNFNEPNGIVGSCSFNSNPTPPFMLANNTYVLKNTDTLKCILPTKDQIDSNAAMRDVLNKQIACPTAKWAKDHVFGGIDSHGFFWAGSALNSSDVINKMASSDSFSMSILVYKPNTYFNINCFLSSSNDSFGDNPILSCFVNSTPVYGNSF